MSLGFSRFDAFTLAGTAIVAAIAISQPVQAKTAKEVAQVAVPTTVQINNTLSPDRSGSGVIVAKNGNTYTVLTANHVVNNPNSEFVIRTSKGKDYPVLPNSIVSFQSSGAGPDLAIAKFESSEEYAVAPISDSDEATIGSGVYISGYPLPALGSTEREYAFTNGQISNVRSNNPEGYTLRYNAGTRRGMSGGPVFDVSGRVIGIHGQGDTVGIVQNESGGGSEDIKGLLNSGIPINTFMGLLTQAGIERSQLIVDDSAPENADAEKINDGDVNRWFEAFAFNVGIDILRRGGVPVPGIPRLPF